MTIEIGSNLKDVIGFVSFLISLISMVSVVLYFATKGNYHE